MLNNRKYLFTELIILFFITPTLLALPIPNALKITPAILGVIYCFVITKRFKLIQIKQLYQINFSGHLNKIIVTFFLIIISTTLLMYFIQPKNLFLIVIKNPLLWISVVFFYSIFSVFPQELLYRSFFFNRYHNLFKNKKYLLFINILAFPVAHLFLKNELVLLITLIGGIFFSFTYYKSKSVLLSSIEHAIYGSWLFTVGMGEMLAFPMPH
jgi:membrane protease YdiL (CAAX protease family)